MFGEAAFTGRLGRDPDLKMVKGGTRLPGASQIGSLAGAHGSGGDNGRDCCGATLHRIAWREPVHRHGPARLRRPRQTHRAGDSQSGRLPTGDCSGHRHFRALDEPRRLALLGHIGAGWAGWAGWAGYSCSTSHAHARTYEGERENAAHPAHPAQRELDVAQPPQTRADQQPALGFVPPETARGEQGPEIERRWRPRLCLRLCLQR